MKEIAIKLDGLINLEKQQFGKAIACLTDAFSEDPCLKYLLNSETYDPEKAKHIHEYTLNIGRLYGYTFATGKEVEGVCIWLPPNRVDVSSWMFIRAGGLGMKRTVYPGIIETIKRYGDYSGEIHHRNAQLPHWYLLSIGISKNNQGRGYANTLMKPMLQYFDKNRQSCYLETHNPKNVAFYERYGFKVVEIGKLPKSEKTHWAMYREAKELEN